MIQKILIGVDGSMESEAALQYGVALAKTFQAELQSVHVVDIVQVEGSLLHDLAGAIGAAPQLNLTTLMRENLEARGRQLLTQFRQTCEEEHLPCVDHLVIGVVPTEITRLACDVDIVLLGRGGMHTRLSKALLGSVVESVIRSGIKPTMVSPERYAEIRQPLLATDGSPPAMAALATATMFARQFDVPLTVVYGTPEAGRREAFLDDIEARLTADGVTYTVDVYEGNAHEDLVHYVREHHHDLLFMGAFGHQRIIEWVLGSTTQYLLRTSPIPLVLCPAETSATA